MVVFDSMWIDSQTSGHTWRRVRLKMEVGFLGFTCQRPKKRSVALVLWTTNQQGICDGMWVNGHHKWWYVSPKMEIRLLGFAYWRPKKRFAALVLQNDWEKLTDLKGGLYSMVWRQWFFIVAIQRQRGLVEAVKVVIVLNWMMVCLVDQFGSRDGEGRDKRDEKYWVFPNRWIILYTCITYRF